MDVQELNNVFKWASQLAERGDLQASADSYETCLRIVQDSVIPWTPDALSKFVRSTAINLAQVLNKQGKSGQALERIDLAMANSPTPSGRALALSARGEALCGLGRMDEGTKAFEEAIRAQPILGCLNSADSMTRVESTSLLGEAQRLIDLVLSSYREQLDANFRAEAYTINGKIAARRAEFNRAQEWFAKALGELPEYADAKLQMRLLRASASDEQMTPRGVRESTHPAAALSPADAFTSSVRQTSCAHCGKSVSTTETVAVDASWRVVGFDVLNNEDVDALLATLRRKEAGRSETIQVCRACAQSLKEANDAHVKVLRSQASLSASTAQLYRCMAKSTSVHEAAVAVEAAMHQLDLDHTDWLAKVKVALGPERQPPEVGVQKDLAEARQLVEGVLGPKQHRSNLVAAIQHAEAGRQSQESRDRISELPKSAPSPTRQPLEGRGLIASLKKLFNR